MQTDAKTAEKAEKAPQNPNEPDNVIILHYEEMDDIDISVEILPIDVADFLLKSSVIGKETAALQRSKDLVHRVTGSAVAFAIEQMEERLDIRSTIGWYAIVEDCEGFYKFMKQRYWKKASEVYYAKKLAEAPNE